MNPPDREAGKAARELVTLRLAGGPFEVGTMAGIVDSMTRDELQGTILYLVSALGGLVQSISQQHGLTGPEGWERLAGRLAAGDESLPL